MAYYYVDQVNPEIYLFTIFDQQRKCQKEHRLQTAILKVLFSIVLINSKRYCVHEETMYNGEYSSNIYTIYSINLF